MSAPELSERSPQPDRPPEYVELERLPGLVQLVLAEADHPLSRAELRQGAWDRQDARFYQKTGRRKLDSAIGQQMLLGHLEALAFPKTRPGQDSAPRARLTAKGLEALERDNAHYRDHVTATIDELVRVASERVPDRRPPGRETRIVAENTLGGGITVSWTNFEVGLMRIDGSDLMLSEEALLPERYQRFGDLYLVERRFEFGDLESGHVEETLVFDYPKRDRDSGEARYRSRRGGPAVPNMQTEIARDRVSLGTLRQLTAELGGRPQSGRLAHLRTD